MPDKIVENGGLDGADGRKNDVDAGQMDQCGEDPELKQYTERSDSVEDDPPPGNGCEPHAQ